MHSFRLCGCGPLSMDTPLFTKSLRDDEEPAPTAPAVAPRTERLRTGALATNGRPATDESLCMQCDDEGPSPTPPAKRQKLEQYPPLPSKSLRVKGTIYRVSDGVYKKWSGNQLRMLCTVCVIKTANYKDKEGRCNKLCSDHAREAGTYVVQNPCRDCPNDNKLDAAYKDEDGRCKKLCSAHAREAGTYVVLNPCRDCPDDNKQDAAYKDEDGRCKKLCSAHAREAGTYACLLYTSPSPRD